MGAEETVELGSEASSFANRQRSAMREARCAVVLWIGFSSHWIIEKKPFFNSRTFVMLPGGNIRAGINAGTTPTGASSPFLGSWFTPYIHAVLLSKVIKTPGASVFC
jgi:hypothetical protein